MMLKGWSGAIETPAGFDPAGPIHCEKGAPALLSSSATRLSCGSPPDSLSARAVWPVEQEDLRAAVLEHHHEARRRRGRRKERRSGPGGEDAAEGGGVGDRVARADGDRVAAAHAVPLKREGDAVHQRGEPGVVELRVALDERGAARTFGCMGADQVRQSGEIPRKQLLGPH